MLYVYIINIFIYSGTRSVLGSVPVRFGYFGYKNIGTVRVFKGIGPVPVSGISVRFRFGSSVPVILPRPIWNHWQESDDHRITESNSTSWDDDKTEGWFSLGESQRIEPIKSIPILVPFLSLVCVYLLAEAKKLFRWGSQIIFEWGRDFSQGPVFLSFVLCLCPEADLELEVLFSFVFFSNLISICWSFVSLEFFLS